MAKSPFAPDEMKKRFWELTDRKEALEKELAPLREKRDNMRDRLRGPLAEFKVAGLAVIAIERPRMGEIDNEMAVIARALANRVGERPA